MPFDRRRLVIFAGSALVTAVITAVIWVCLSSPESHELGFAEQAKLNLDEADRLVAAMAAGILVLAARSASLLLRLCPKAT